MAGYFPDSPHISNIIENFVYYEKFKEIYKPKADGTGFIGLKFMEKCLRPKADGTYLMGLKLTEEILLT